MTKIWQLGKFRETLWAATTSAGARILAMLASLASSMILARLLGAEEYGLYSFGLTVATTLSTAVSLGLPTLLTRETGHAMATGNPRKMYSEWFFAAKLMLVTGSTVTLAYLAWLMSGSDLGGARHKVLLSSIPLIILFSAAGLVGSMLMGMGRLLLSILPEHVLRPSFLAVGAGVVAWYAGGLDSVGATCLHSLAAILALGVGFAFLEKARPKLSLERGEPARLEWWAPLRDLSLVVALQSLNQSVDTLLLAAWSSNTEVGIYRMALSVAQMSTFGVVVGSMIVQGKAAALYARREYALLQALLTTASRVGFASVITSCVILAPFGAGLLTFVFGSSYRPAALPLLILLIGNACMSFVGAAGSALAMLGCERDLLWGTLIGLTAKSVSCIFLIPRLGSTGAAVANAVGIALAAAYWAQSVKLRLGLRSTAT